MDKQVGHERGAAGAGRRGRRGAASAKSWCGSRWAAGGSRFQPSIVYETPSILCCNTDTVSIGSKFTRERQS